MSDVMSVRLHLWGVRVRGVGVDSTVSRSKWNQLGSGRGAHTVGSAATRCGTGGRRGFVILG